MKQINKVSKAKSLLLWQGMAIENGEWKMGIRKFGFQIINSWLLVVSFLSITSSLKAQKLTGNSKVSLITIGPGKELYSVFGHSGLWVSDPTLGIDKVYSYGTFDFETPGFLIKFVRGTLPYQISEASLPRNLDYYSQKENRSVTEDILKLTLPQRQTLFDSLEFNLRPENKEYRYKFFYDNCSTRLRDKVEIAAGDSVSYSDVDELYHQSFRQFMNKYLGEKPWAKFGMNMALGNPADQTASQTQSMYLPDNLELAFQKARVRNNGRLVHLVGEIKPLYKATPMPDETPSYLLTPQFVFLCLLLMVTYFTYYHWKTKQFGYWLDRWLFGVLGIVGLLLLFLWFGTDHIVTGYNYSLLWALPIHIPTIFLMQEKKRPTWHWIYFLGVAIAAAVGMLMCEYLIKDVFPLVFCILIRCFYHFSLERHRRRSFTGKFRM